MKKILLLSFISFAAQLHAQVNLVPNPSFEDYVDCPYSFDGFFDSATDFTIVDQWMKPSAGTSDLMNACATISSGMNVPDNFFGYRYAHTGVGYAGMYTVLNDYREYIQTQLTDSMEAGNCYYIEYYVAPAFRIDVASGLYYNLTTDQFGLNIAVERYTNPLDAGIIDIEANLSNPEGYYLKDTVNWTKTGGFYFAEGGESWIILGNFSSIAETDPILIDSAYVDAAALSYGYFFVDDVLVTLADSAIYLKDTAICDLTYTILGPVGADGYEWSTGDTSLNLTVAESGDYWVNINTPCGILSDTATITFITVAADYTSENILICESEFPYEISAPGGYSSWLWSTGETTENITITEPGVYIVESLVECGVLTDTITVEAVVPPGLDLGNDTLICGEQPYDFVLDAGAGFLSYAWSTGDNTQSITITEPGTYSLDAATPCALLTDELTVTGDPYADVEYFIGNDTSLCQNYSGGALFLSAPSGLPNYLWNTGSTAQSISVNQEGLYWVESTGMPCGDMQDSILISICNDVFLPNAFSPNGDGINDVIYIIGLQPQNLISFTIYNRWGEIVFETNNITDSWDGIFNGLESPMGVYAWTVQYETGGVKQMQSGNITLVR